MTAPAPESFVVVSFQAYSLSHFIVALDSGPLIVGEFARALSTRSGRNLAKKSRSLNPTNCLPSGRQPVGGDFGFNSLPMVIIGAIFRGLRYSRPFLLARRIPKNRDSFPGSPGRRNSVEAGNQNATVAEGNLAEFGIGPGLVPVVIWKLRLVVWWGLER
jgi:hypothetical protein